MEKFSNKVKIIVLICIILTIIGVLFFIFKNKKDYDLEVVTSFDYFVVESNKKQGVISKAGKVLIEPQYDEVIIPNPMKKIFICRNLKEGKSDEYTNSVLDDEGKIIFDKYEEVEPIAINGISNNLPYEKSVLKYKKNGKYGLINYNGKNVAKAKYDEIASVKYKEGEILVKENDKYGVINNKGNKLIKAEYEEIIGDGYYSESDKYKLSGYIVKKNGKYGYIDKNWKLAIEPQYDSIERILELGDKDNVYLLAKKEDKIGVIKNSETVLDFDYQTVEYNKINKVFLASMVDKFGVYDENGKIVIERKYDKISFEGKYAFAKAGETEVVFWFKEDGISETVYTKEKEKYKSQNGKELKYRGLYPIENEKYYISVDSEEKYGVVDENGEELIPSEYMYLEYYKDDCFIGLLKGKLGVINTSGDVLLTFKYGALQRIKGTNVLEAKMVKEGVTELYSSKFEKMISLNRGQAIVCKDYIRTYSNDTVNCFDFDGVEKSEDTFSKNQLSLINKNGKWGIADKSGKNVLDCEYEMITEFNEAGYAGIKKDGKWGVVDKEAKIVLEPTYSKLSTKETPEFLGKYYKSYNKNEVYYTDKAN